MNTPRVTRTRKGISKRIEAIGIPSTNEEKHNEFVQFLNTKSQCLENNSSATVANHQNNKVIFLPPQTVFKELYDCCDTEAKLILLDEISLLGDEKELLLAVSELNAPEEIIRKKAARIIPMLETRIKILSLESSIRSKNYHQESQYDCDTSSFPLEYTLLLEELEINSSKLASISKKEPKDLQRFIRKINLKLFSYKSQK